MLIGMTSRFLCNIACYLYPSYASYKALSLPPTAEAASRLQRWLMYWAVVGVWTVLESVAGWAVSWIPFYSVFRTAFFLWLSLPQTEGSTIIYETLLSPLFDEHERDIDAFLASLRSRAGGAVVSLLNWAWVKARESLNLAVQTPASGMTGDLYSQGSSHQPAIQQPPTLADPGSGALQGVYSLATRYALQYLPLMATAVTAATASAQPRMEMPIPQPTPRRPSSIASLPRAPPPAAYDVPESYAGRPPSPPARARVSSTSRSIYPSVSSSLPAHPSSVHPRSVSTPSMRGVNSSVRGGYSSAEGSEEERRWGGASGYEEIRREEVEGVEGEERPPVGRGGSWFGWGGGYAPVGSKDKAD